MFAAFGKHSSADTCLVPTQKLISEAVEIRRGTLMSTASAQRRVTVNFPGVNSTTRLH